MLVHDWPLLQWDDGFRCWGPVSIRQPLPGLIHHSDRGSQYCSYDYRKLLAANGMVETVFQTIKSELIGRACAGR